MSLTLIDPLEGYYRDGVVDPNTGLPVTRQVLEDNFERHRVPRESWRLFQALSSDPGALQAASDRRYHLIFVDGDHSYDGVVGDAERYAPLVAEGGFLVFDDYHNDAWPGVTRAVDEVVMALPGFAHVGSGWMSAVFRRTASQPPDGSSQSSG